MTSENVVRQVVARAIESKEVLWVSKEAKIIAARFGLPEKQVADELTKAGLRARVNMELGVHDGALEKVRSK